MAIALTTYSPQQALNLLAGNAPLTKLSEQTVVNRAYGYGDTAYSLQTALALQASQPLPGRSPQRQLFANLSGYLSLSGADTAYSEQYLLNMAVDAGLTLNHVLGLPVGGGGASGQPIGLLLTLTQP